MAPDLLAKPDVTQMLVAGYPTGYLHSRLACNVTRPKHRYCPCPEKHKKSVSTTPSDPNYMRNLLGELKRKTCWKDET
jgi:hypothetical protein